MPKWRKERKLLNKTFHPKVVEDYFDVFELHGNNLIRVLEQEVGKPTMEVMSILDFYSMDTVMRTKLIPEND